MCDCGGKGDGGRGGTGARVVNSVGNGYCIGATSVE